MLKARIYDVLNYIGKLSFRKLANGCAVYASYYMSRWSGKVVHPGMPISVSIEPTTACNLGCPECPSGLKKFTRETGNLRDRDADEWITELASHVTYINFYFQGEPFIHPRFLDLVKMASKKRVYTSTSTNAHFLHHELAKKTVESGLDRLIISIDGTTQEVYEQYRVHGKLSKVLEGTKNILFWKKELKSRTPYVILQFLVVKPNEHQVEEIRALGRSLGVDEVKFKTAQVYDYENGNPLIPENEKYSRYKKRSDGKYEIKNRLDDHCWRMWSGCVLTWDGLVVPCCFDKDATHRMGDMKDHSLSEIWNNVRYQNFRAGIFRNRKEIDICANCSEGTKVWT